MSLRSGWRTIRKTVKRWVLPQPKAGDLHHRAFVGPPRRYDRVGRLQLDTMRALGLRPEHRLLDIGCGSLRAGKHFIPYLERGHYFGIEPNRWLVEEGIAKELGRRAFEARQPSFRYESDFPLSGFGVRFHFMIAQSIFTHASARQIERCLSQVAAALEPDGIFVANFLPGDTDYTGEEWVYPECCTYTLGFLQSLAGKHGLSCESFELEKPWPGDLVMLRIRRAPESAAGPERR